MIPVIADSTPEAVTLEGCEAPTDPRSHGLQLKESRQSGILFTRTLRCGAFQIVRKGNLYGPGKETVGS